MRKIDVGQTINTLANIGVLTGIGFLAYEIRQNTVATQLSAAESYAAELNAVDRVIVENPDFAQALLTGLNEELPRVEVLRINLYSRMLLRQWQSAFFQYQTSGLPPQFLSQLKQDVGGIISQDRNVRRSWETRKSSYDPDFVEFVESAMAEYAAE